MKDYYLILGIHEDVSINEIKIAYRTLMKIWHPDICSQNDAHKRFVEITEAYSILSDQLKRKQYDEIRRASESAEREQAEEYSTTTFEDISFWAQILTVFKWLFLIIFIIICMIFVVIIAYKVYTTIHGINE
ncbi:MAG: DnaJ domain-containing protein [Desulfitobacteriaceae bacterium]